MGIIFLKALGTMSNVIKTRFAPSPTGFIHIGNLRTALFSYLYAKKHKGVFLLRIEDTDVARSEERYVEQLVADLKWLGLTVDEGPAPAAGDKGPYYQSQRLDTYQKYYDQLIASGEAYPCYCTALELDLSRKQQLAAGRPPRYEGTCLRLSDQQKKDKAHLPSTLRFKMPAGSIVFSDLVQGSKKFEAADLGDWIIRKQDGMPTFMFCNAIDDALMQVTHVLRGEDHMTNTPRQLVLLERLGLPVPFYGHVPMIFGFDGKPLSKRNGSQAITELKEKGYHPLAILNLLARLGHHYENPEFLTQQGLAEHFEIERIGRAPAHFLEEQLMYWQKNAIHHLALPELLQLLHPYLDRVPVEKRELFAKHIQANLTFPAEAADWAEVFFGNLVLSSEAKAVLQPVSKAYFEQAIAAFGAGKTMAEVLGVLKESLSLKGKGLFLPMRVALTGMMDGPEMDKIYALLGKEGVVARLTAVMHGGTHAS